MSQPRKILSASCLALALIFGSEHKAQAINIDDSLSIEAGLERCTANTELAQLTIEGCYKGLQFVSADFPHRNRQFKDLPTCLSTMKNLDVHSLLERQFQRCDREWTHIYFRRGCKDAAIAYYSSLDPVTFCTRGGVGTVPVMPLHPAPAPMQSRESDFQFVLSEPLLPRMTPLFQKPRASSAPVAGSVSEPVVGKSKVESKKPAQPSPVATAEKTSSKVTAKPAEKTVKPVVDKQQAPEKQAAGNAVTDVKKPAGTQEKKAAVTMPAGEISAAKTQNDKATAPAPKAPAKPAPVDNAGFVSATNVTGNLLQGQTESIAVPFKPSAPDASGQQVLVLPEVPVIPLIPSGQLPKASTQETHSTLPPPNQFVYQNKSAQQPTSLRDIPLGVPNQPVEGLASTPPVGSLSSPALPQPSPQPPVAPQVSAPVVPTPLPVSVSNVPSPVAPAPPATPVAGTGTVPVNNPAAATVMLGNLPTTIAPNPSPAPVVTTPVSPPMAATPFTAGAQQPGTSPMASMPGFATPGMAPQPQTQTPQAALPGFFSSPEQTQTQSNFSGNQEQTFASSSEAVNSGQPAAPATTGNTGSSIANIPSGAPTPPPSLSVPFAEDPR